MDDLIFRSAAIKQCERHSDYTAWSIKDGIEALPTIDPESLRAKGRWITHTVGHGKYANNYVECSECHTVGSPRWKCCPVCEAKMEENNDA